MLKTESSDPEIVAEAFALLDCLRNGSQSFDITTNLNIERDRSGVRNQQLASRAELVHYRGVLLVAPGSRHSNAKLCENEQRHEQLPCCSQRIGEGTVGSE